MLYRLALDYYYTNLKANPLSISSKSYISLPITTLKIRNIGVIFLPSGIYLSYRLLLTRTLESQP
jgi:hypothetical protein